MLVRIGSRGSRLALDAGRARRARSLAARPATRSRFVPITTAGDRDRTSPFGQIGERGVFVKEIEEALLAGPDRRRRPLREGHDLDRHRRVSPSARTSSATTRATRSSAPTRSGRGCGSARRRSAAARSCSRSSRRVSVEPLRGNVDTRLRKARERGLDALVLAAAGSTGSASPSEIGLRIPVETMLPEAAQGALALQVRAGEEELVARRRRRRDAPARRGRARVRRDGRRRLPRAGRGASRRRAADGADRRRGRLVARAAQRRRPGAARRGAARGGRGARAA